MTINPKYYNGTVMCDKCRTDKVEKHLIFYHCEECKYDLCRACALSINNVLSLD
jgi:hypothetical protein